MQAGQAVLVRFPRQGGGRVDDWLCHDVWAHGFSNVRLVDLWHLWCPETDSWFTATQIHALLIMVTRYGTRISRKHMIRIKCNTGGKLSAVENGANAVFAVVK